MKKLIILLVLAALITGTVLVRGALDKRRALAGPQGDPQRAVETLMDSFAKLSKLIYEESHRENLVADVDALKDAPEPEAEAAMQDVFEKYGLHPIKPFFVDEKLGKGVTSVFLLFRFDTYEITKTTVKDDSAWVHVKFTPTDVLGIAALTAKLGAPAPEQKREPVTISFGLDKDRHRWYITEISGELATPINAFSRLR